MTVISYRPDEKAIPARAAYSGLDKIPDNNAKTAYIFTQLYAPLNIVASRMLGYSADAEDVVMNVIYKVVKSQTQPKTFEHLRRRLFVSVRHEAINFIRYQKRHNKALACVFELQQHFTTPANFANRDEGQLLHALSAEVKRLSPQQQIVVRSYFFDNMSTTQIANMLGLNKQTVLNHKIIALRRLQNSALSDAWNHFLEK